MITFYLIEHEGKRIIVEPANCNPAHFRSAIRFIRTVKVDEGKWCKRRRTREARGIAEKARRGTPIKYRLHRIHEYKFWM